MLWIAFINRAIQPLINKYTIKYINYQKQIKKIPINCMCIRFYYLLGLYLFTTIYTKKKHKIRLQKSKHYKTSHTKTFHISKTGSLIYKFFSFKNWFKCYFITSNYVCVLRTPKNNFFNNLQINACLHISNRYVNVDQRHLAHKKFVDIKAT